MNTVNQVIRPAFTAHSQPQLTQLVERLQAGNINQPRVRLAQVEVTRIFDDAHYLILHAWLGPAIKIQQSADGAATAEIEPRGRLVKDGDFERVSVIAVGKLPAL